MRPSLSTKPLLLILDSGDKITADAKLYLEPGKCGRGSYIRVEVSEEDFRKALSPEQVPVEGTSALMHLLTSYRRKRQKRFSLNRETHALTEDHLLVGYMYLSYHDPARDRSHPVSLDAKLERILVSQAQRTALQSLLKQRKAERRLPPRAHLLEYLVVHPRARGQKIAEWMLGYVLRHVATPQDLLLLGAQPTEYVYGKEDEDPDPPKRPVLVSFYEKLGFKRVPAPLPPEEDQVLMYKLPE